MIYEAGAGLIFLFFGGAFYSCFFLFFNLELKLFCNLHIDLNALLNVLNDTISNTMCVDWFVGIGWFAAANVSHDPAFSINSVPLTS